MQITVFSSRKGVIMLTYSRAPMTSLAWGPVGHCTSGCPLNPPLSNHPGTFAHGNSDNDWWISHVKDPLRSVRSVAVCILLLLILQSKFFCRGQILLQEKSALHTNWSNAGAANIRRAVPKVLESFRENWPTTYCQLHCVPKKTGQWQTAFCVCQREH